MKKYLLASILALSSLPGVALAADTGSSVPARPQDPTLERARAAIAQKDWASAQSTLRDAVAREPSNADYHNLYAYSIRKGANPDMSLVFKHYNEALSIDPKHKAAHEYIGEAYLIANDLENAERHLSALEKICLIPCEEYEDLKKAVAEHRRRAAK